MKFTVTFKDPDALEDQIREAVERDVAGLALSEKESELLTESRFEDVSSAVAKWFRYGEYVEIEIDTEADTATVKRHK